MDILQAIGMEECGRSRFLRSCEPLPGLPREEALFAGTSSGANVVAAIQVAERLEPDSKVVTLMVDSGLKYLSADVYRSRGRSVS